MKKAQNNNRLVDFGTVYSIFIYIITAVLKIIFGTLGNSAALFTDGLNSISDVVATLVLYVGLKLSRKPRDDDHAYGHYRYEQIATLIASFIMAIIGIEAFRQSITKLLSPEKVEPSILTAVIAGISFLLILSSAIINYYIAKKTNMSTARAVMKNNISDSYTVLGTLIAIITSRFNLPIIDVIASFIISLIILKTAFEIFMEAGINLSDGFDTVALETYRMEIKNTHGVLKVIDIRGRMLGNNTVLDVTIAVNRNLTVSQAHLIADLIEVRMAQHFGIYRTTIHIEPDDIRSIPII